MPGFGVPWLADASAQYGHHPIRYDCRYQPTVRTLGYRHCQPSMEP
jgi:hypothetical protein